MKIRITAIFLLLFLPICLFAQESKAPEADSGPKDLVTMDMRLGFGNQPSYINKKLTDDSVLAKRVLSATKYKLTPGDSYELIIKLDTMETIPLVLHDDYKLEIPFLGTITVKGMYFSDLRTLIISRIKAKVPVEYVDFFLTSPALFDIFIYGGVENPGIATVTPITRVTDALAVVGGLKPGATYRQIELVRNSIVIKCDLAKFIRDADLEQNPLLEPGDKIYVPHAQIIVQISGQIYFPDYYELLSGETLKDVLNFAGGLLKDADQENIEILRIKADNQIELLNVSYSAAAETALLFGDRIYIKSRFSGQDMILLEAAVYGRPPTSEPQVIPTKPVVVSIPYIPGMTLLQLLNKLGGPTPLADPNNSYIIRGPQAEKIKINLYELWDLRKTEYDIYLQPNDHIFIPLQKLKIVVAGQVNNPGNYNYVTGGIVADYIAMAGGIDLDKGSPKDIYFVDEHYNRQKVTLDTEVPPGAVIYVDKLLIDHIDYGLTKVLIFVTFTTAIITLITKIISLSQ